MLHESGVGDKIDSLYCGKSLVDPKIALLCPGHTASSGLVSIWCLVKKRMSKRLFSAESRNDNNISTNNISSKTTTVYQMLILCQIVD